jgi:hypothetical protein
MDTVEPSAPQAGHIAPHQFLELFEKVSIWAAGAPTTSRETSTC